MKTIDDTLLENSANRLLSIGSMHGWFTQKNLEELDTIGRDEFLSIVFSIVEPYIKYEALVRFISNDYHELSYEKVQWQRDDWKKRCEKLIAEDWKE